MYKIFPIARKRVAFIVLILFAQALAVEGVYAQENEGGAPDTAEVQEQAAPQQAAEDNGPLPTSEEAISQGQTLFKNNCVVCHQVHQQLVGPALANVTERRPIDWLIPFIINSQRVIQEGDSYAVELYEEFNKTVMPSFDFSDEEVLSILAYINQESQQAPEVAAEDQLGQQPDTAATQEAPAYLNAILIGVLIVLALILVVLLLIVSILTKYIKQREDLGDEEKAQLAGKVKAKTFFTSRPVIGIIAFIFIAILLKSVIDQLYHVGVQEGYAPAQPVWFSHKIHAGTYQIDCNYCHTGAMDGKNAGIPSVNVCMNCHNPENGGITLGTVTGETELAKVINAYQNEEPIEWIRVHNLPDLSYFNHAQHVNVAGIECQTCHGPIEEMDVVQQASTLTMGWCIDCHRTTPVNTEGNEYYDKLVEIHSEISGEPLTVDMIGGTECFRCHY